MPPADVTTADEEPILKPVDAWWTVLLVDPIAVRLVRVVQRWTWVTPMRLTVAAHLLGLLSVALFAAGELIAAAVLFEVRFVLDCADGKLARVRGTPSASGAYVDYVGDYVVAGLVATGLALHLVWRADVSVVLAVAFPTAFLLHIVSGQARDEVAAAAGLGDRRDTGRPAGRYERWMAARRLRPVPSRIEAEHVALFLAPIVAVVVDDRRPLTWTVAVVTAYFAYRAARMGAAGYLIAASRDREDRSRRP